MTSTEQTCRDCDLCGGTTLLRTRCSTCRGVGEVQRGEEDRECDDCDGEGWYDTPCSSCAVWASELAMPACDGSPGQVDLEVDARVVCEQYVCPHCNAALCPPRPPTTGRLARCPPCDGVFMFDGVELVAAGTRIGDFVYFVGGLPEGGEG